MRSTAGDDVLLAALDERLGAGERTRARSTGWPPPSAVPRRRVYELALAARDRRSAGEASGRPRTRVDRGGDQPGLR